MSETDRQLGRAEQELRQAIDCIQQCHRVLVQIVASDGVLSQGVLEQSQDAMRSADWLLRSKGAL